MMASSTTVINNIEGAIAALHGVMDREDFEEEEHGLIQQMENNIQDEETHVLADAGVRKQAKDEYIDSGTRSGYMSSLKRMIEWFFDQRNNIPEKEDDGDESKEPYGAILTDHALEMLSNCQNHTSAKRKKSEKGKALNTLLAEMHDGKCPFHLDKLMLDSDYYLDFLLSRRGKNGSRYCSASGYGNYNSALHEMFRRSNLQYSNDFRDKLTIRTRALARLHQREKEEMGTRLTEGKDPMPFVVYKFLAAKMLESVDKEAIFAHTFMLLTWNLMCRSKNTVNIMFNHISWCSDSIGIQFAHSKTDKEGLEASYLRHIYANSASPEICPITALARYIMVFPECCGGRLFSETAYDTLRKYLQKLCSKYHDELMGLGVDSKNIGVHSLRKGAATYACNGTTDAPQIASVCNRAGWTMGKVKDIYIKYDRAGDQYVGRVVCGLDPVRPEFAQTSPFFRINRLSQVPTSKRFFDHATTDVELDYTDNDDSLSLVSSSVLAMKLKQAYPNLMTVQYFPLARLFLAALLYSRSFFDNITCKTSIFRFTIFFQPVFDDIEEKVMVPFPWKKAYYLYWEYGNLTGIPAHTCIMVEQRKCIELMVSYGTMVQKGMQGAVQDCVNGIITELNKRNLSGGSLTMDMIQDTLLLPLQNQMTELKDALIRLQSGHNTVDGSCIHEGGVNNTLPLTSNSDIPWFKWSLGKDGDDHRRLPENFKLCTNITLKQMWKMWHVPHRTSEHVLPAFKNCTSHDFSSKTQKRYFSHLRMIMEKIDEKVGHSYLDGELEYGTLDILFDRSEAIKNDIMPAVNTATGRKRHNTNKNGWLYLSAEYSKRNPMSRGRPRKRQRHGNISSGQGVQSRLNFNLSGT